MSNELEQLRVACDHLEQGSRQQADDVEHLKAAVATALQACQDVAALRGNDASSLVRHEMGLGDNIVCVYFENILGHVADSFTLKASRHKGHDPKRLLSGSTVLLSWSDQ